MNPVMKSETSAAVPQSQTEGYGEFSPFLYIYFCHNRIKVAPDRDSSFQQLLGAADIDNEDQHGSQSAITLRMWVIGVAFSIIGCGLNHSSPCGVLRLVSHSRLRNCLLIQQVGSGTFWCLNAYSLLGIGLCPWSHTRSRGRSVLRIIIDCSVIEGLTA